MARRAETKRNRLPEERAENRRRAICAAVMFAAFILIAAALDSYRCSRYFIVHEYTIGSDKVSSPVRIVMLSDLHESEFGEGNSKLIEAVSGLTPDVIVCVGDMVSSNARGDEASIGIDLIRKLAGIAPVFVSLGNHEKEYVSSYGPGLLNDYRAAGAVVLEREYADISAHGETVRIGGVSEYCFNHWQPQEEYEQYGSYRFMREFCDTGSFKLLLCHIPSDYYSENRSEQFENWDCDLVLSGHTHGGLWQLPLIGAPYLPRQGFFPKLDRGMKDMGSAKMIIGAGLGHEAILFRLNDPCEIVCVDIVPER